MNNAPSRSSTHTQWKVTVDHNGNLIRTKYPLNPQFADVVREYGIQYKNKRTTGPRLLVKWLSQQQYNELHDRTGG